MEKRIGYTALKHIYLINNNSRAAQYGIGTYIRQVVKFMQPLGWSITIINLSSEQKNPEIEKIDSVLYFNLPYPSYVTNEKYLFRYYRAVGTFLALHVDTSSDNVFHFNYLQHFPLQKIIKERFPQGRTVLTVHYLNWHFTLKGNTTQFLQIITKEESEQNEKEKEIVREYNQDKSFFRDVDSIICLAGYTKQLLMQQYSVEKIKISLIRNAVAQVDVAKLNREEKAEKRRQLHIGAEEKLILFVGRLDALKGIEYLVEAYRSVLATVPDSRLWIVGDGNYSLGLKKADAVWNRITFTGRISQDVLFTLYQIADIGVIPSLCEQCSYVAVEMMKFGLPVIGTTANGLKEMLVEYGGSMVELTEMQDDVLFPVEQLSQSIIKSLSRMDCFCSACSDLECYSIERMKTEMVNVYMNN